MTLDKSAQAMIKQIMTDYPELPGSVVQNIVKVYISSPKQFRKSVEELKEKVFDKMENGVVDMENMQVIKPGTEEYENIISSKFKPPNVVAVQPSDRVDDAPGDGYAIQCTEVQQGESPILQSDAAQ
jgi:hypothetical protein